MTQDVRMVCHHMMQFSVPVIGEGLPFGPQRESLHPTVLTGMHEEGMPEACAWCGWFRLEESPVPVASVLDLHEGFCIRDGIKWRASWNVCTCSMFSQGPVPVQIYPPQTDRMMREGRHPFMVDTSTQTTLSEWSAPRRGEI